MIKKTLNISEVVKKSGIAASTLRYYEKLGIIKSIGRTGIRRIYNDSIVEQLAIILLARSTGFTLKEIATIFVDGGITIDKDKLSHKADQLDETITQQIIIRDGLRHAAICPAPSHLECPKFRKLLRIAIAMQRKSINLY